jgi:hypothetical protein
MACNAIDAKCSSPNLGAIFCYIATKMAELEQDITLIGDSADPQITTVIKIMINDRDHDQNKKMHPMCS